MWFKASLASIIALPVFFLYPSGTVWATEITNMTWNSDSGVIEVELDAWPGQWDGWKMRLNGSLVSIDGQQPGSLSVRPNAPLDTPPTGLYIGTLPWLTGLQNVNFPCCGVIQFEIPGAGKTNEYEFNFVVFGCQTASSQKCPNLWEHHTGDLILQGSDVKIIDDAKYYQEGHIYIRDQAKLIVKDSEMMIARGTVPSLHVYFFIDPNASLEIINSSIYKNPLTDTHVCAFNEGSVTITDSTASIHYFDNGEGAELTLTGSTMVTAIGGILQVGGGTIHVQGSTVGALGIRIPANATLGAAGLKSGEYFQLWDVHDIIPAANYDLILEETQILKDDLGDGPYERGWIFFAHPDAHVRLKDCEIRKVFIDLNNTKAEFNDLKIGTPCSMTYRDIVLENVTMRGQWPFSLDNATAIFRNCENLFLQPAGKSMMTLIDSSISEFIPRDYTGTIDFDNGVWDAAGEILGNVPYHSTLNDFTMRGSLTLAGDLRNNLQFKDAQVTREYEILVRDINGKPVQGAGVTYGGTVHATDGSGRAFIDALWNGATYNQPQNVKITLGSATPVTAAIDFFTNTPVTVTLNTSVTNVESWGAMEKRE